MPYFKWDGHKLFYRQQGGGPLLVILPGNTASSAHLRGDIDYFCKRFQVVALDFLGTGQSDRVDVWADQWWLQGAHQVVALIDHLGYERAILMGASGGAIVCLLTDIHFPKKVKAVIADSFVEQAPPDQFRDLVIADRKIPTHGLKEFWQTAHGDDWEQVIAADTAMLERFAAQGADWLQGQLDQTQCPVMLTGSLKDEFIPGISDQFIRMVETISDCRLYLHPQGGHPLMWSEPDVFRSVSDIFLSEICKKEK